jgi:hypothetical protein
MGLLTVSVNFLVVIVMKAKTIIIEFKGKKYKIQNLLGFLLEYDSSNEQDKYVLLNNKNIEKISNPYLLKSNIEETKILKLPKKIFPRILATVYTFLCLRSFLFFRFLSYLRFPIFNSTTEAIIFYRDLFPTEQNELCLPRALFAASTSKSFYKKGYLYIGVFLPSRAMHAWIIENDTQPDFQDDIWICYNPVLVMFN